MAKITPKFDFSSSEPAYTPTLIQHNTTPVPHNALKPAIFNEYERVMLTLANAIGDLAELTNVLPNGPQDIASIIRALMDKYADKVTTRSLEVTGSASIGAMRLEWKNNQQYYVGDIIVYEKKLYRCKEQHKAENMPFTYYISKWELIGGGGSTSIDVTMPAHGFRVGEVLCYYNTYIKAKANNRDTVGLFVVSKVADEDNFTIMQGGYFKLDDDTNLQGIIEGGASYFTPNTLYYLSPTINGGITATEPYISQPVIFAISETEGYVLCQRPQNVSIPLSDEFTYNPGQQSYNLSYQPATNSNLLVIVDNYILPSTSYSINNNTITLTDTYDDTTKIRVVYYATHAYNPAASLKEYKFTTNNPTGPGNYVLEEAPIAKQYLIVSLNGEILDSDDYELISNVFTLNIPSQDDVLRILVILESRVVAPDLLGISDNTIPGEKILQGSIMPSKLHPDILARLTTTWKDVLKPGVYDAITGEITSTTEATLSSGSMLISDANNVLHYYELSNSTTVTLQNNTCHIIAYITYDQFKIPTLHIESKLTTDTLPANSIIICTVVFNNSTPTEIVYTYSNYGKQIDFNAPQGNQPFTVTSTTKVNNLNSDLLDGYHASTSASANTIILRDSSGRAKVAAPSAADDIANKGYVDGHHAFVESGSNTNGQWIKFSDGTMICYRWPTTYGSGPVFVWNFPTRFAEKPIAFNCVQGDPNATNSGFVFVGHFSDVSPSAATAQNRYIPGSGVGPLPFSGALLAIGRWK